MRMVARFFHLFPNKTGAGLDDSLKIGQLIHIIILFQIIYIAV